MGVESRACRQMLVDCVLKKVELFSARGLLRFRYLAGSKSEAAWLQRLRNLAGSKAETAFVRLLVVSRFRAWIPGVVMNAR